MESHPNFDAPIESNTIFVHYNGFGIKMGHTHIYLLMWKDIRTLFDVFNSIGDKVGIWVLSLFCHNFGIPIIFNFILVKTAFEFFAY
jgi:hypothetical protein